MMVISCFTIMWTKPSRIVLLARNKLVYHLILASLHLHLYSNWPVTQFKFWDSTAYLFINHDQGVWDPGNTTRAQPGAPLGFEQVSSAEHPYSWNWALTITLPGGGEGADFIIWNHIWIALTGQISNRAVRAFPQKFTFAHYWFSTVFLSMKMAE